MTLRKREDTRIWRRKHYVALSLEVALEEAIDLLKDRLCGDNGITFHKSLIFQKFILKKINIPFYHYRFYGSC